MAEHQYSSRTFNKWFRILSPCVIAIAFCIFAIFLGLVDLEKSGGWSFLIVIIFFSCVIVLLLLDFIVKLIFKKKRLYVWLIELVLIIIGIFIFFEFIYA